MIEYRISGHILKIEKTETPKVYRVLWIRPDGSSIVGWFPAHKVAEIRREVRNAAK